MSDALERDDLWEYAHDEGVAAWNAANDDALESLKALRGATDRTRGAVEAAKAAATLAEVARLEALVSHLLKYPDAHAFEDKYGDTDYYGPTCLEWAEELLNDAWQLLVAAWKRTRSWDARRVLTLSLIRIGVLRARIAHRSPAQSHTPSSRSRTGPVAEVFRSLTQAAHAPPRVAAYPRPVIAGGGPL